MRLPTEPPARGYRQLVAWQKAMDLADRVLDICDRIPARRGAGLVSQLGRAIVSIPSNIAEGHDRPPGEYLSFLRIARGSLREAETQIELLGRRGLIRSETALALLQDADEVGRVL